MSSLQAQRIICTVTNDLTYDQRMLRVASTLADAGYAVQLVGRWRRRSVPLVARSFAQYRLPCRFERGKLFYIEYNVRLFFYLLTAPFDVVCAVDLDTILPALLVARLRRKCCVYDAHEYFTETPEVVRRPLIRRIWETVARWAIPRADAAYTVGEALAQALSTRYGRPFAVVRNVPYWQTAIAQPDPARPAVILYQGVLNEGRGLEQAIAAMQYVEGAELWLAGEGDLSDALRKTAQRLGLTSKVHFLGYLAPEELRKVTLQARLGLNLLERRSLSYYYSLANKAFDYLQAGVPTIHMQFPEYQRINEQYRVALLLEDLEISTLASAVRQLLEDQDLYLELRRNCLRAREVFHWSKEAPRLLAIYNQLLARAR